MTTLQLDSTVLATIASKAILDGIGVDQRDLLLQQALEHLITAPPKSNYGSAQPPSPLQDAFNNAIRESARQVCNELVTGEYGEKVREAVRGHVEKYLADSTMFAHTIGIAIGESVADALKAESRGY